jgi:hypothetical protein
MVKYIRKLNFKISIKFYTILEMFIIKMRKFIGIKNERNIEAIKKYSK